MIVFVTPPVQDIHSTLIKENIVNNFFDGGGGSDSVGAGGELLYQIGEGRVGTFVDEGRNEGVYQLQPFAELSSGQRVSSTGAHAVEGDFLNADWDVLEVLRHRLAAGVHEVGDGFDG